MESRQAVHSGGCVWGCVVNVCIMCVLWWGCGGVEDECVGTEVKVCVCVCVCIDRYSQFR